jgi:adenylate cyclase
MALEIERVFLVVGRPWERMGAGRKLVQGYLHIEPRKTIRVRIGGERARLCIKLAAGGIAREELEYDIPLEDARLLLERATLGHLVEKTRYEHRVGSQTWEVDVFEGQNAGLVLAEAELPSADAPLELPPWIGAEVTSDPRYLNAELALRPYTRWE